MIARADTYYPSDPYQMRFGMWVPVVIAMKLFGQTELGFVGGMLFCSIYGLVLIYLLARQEWTWPYALLAMALLAVYPLDVLCSTLFANDMMLGAWSFTSLFLYRKALAEQMRPAVCFASAVGSGVFVLFGFVTKPWLVLMIPLFAVEALRRRHAWRVSLLTAVAAAFFLGAYVFWQWFRFGDPLYHIDVARPLAIFLPYSRDLLLEYPRMLFQPNQYGSRFAGFYPQLVVALALLFVWRAPGALRWLLYFVILIAGLAALPAGRRDGQWVTLVPHIFRYLASVSIPLCLALAALLRELCRRRLVVGFAVVAVVLVTSVVQSVALTMPSRDAFGEERRANAVLRLYPDEPVMSDHHFLGRLFNFEWYGRHVDRLRPLQSETRPSRMAEYAAFPTGWS
jgi:4-amino-4-deoxy-L-arabinose transferase-like glycosyltransferase